LSRLHPGHVPNSIAGGLPHEWQQVGFGSLEIPEDTSFLPTPHQTPNPTWPGLKERDQERLLNDMAIDFDSDFVFLSDVPDQFAYSQANNPRGQTSGNPAPQTSSNPGPAADVHKNVSSDSSDYVEVEIEPEANESSSGSGSGSGYTTAQSGSSAQSSVEELAIQKVEDIAPKKQKSRGPFQRPEDREETSLTRKNHACVRCRIQKVRVSSKL
jgi:hypothetical protein